MKYILGLSLLLASRSFACEALSAAQLQERLQKAPAEQLVFFASWCASCKKHLTEATVASTYFIAAFDEQPAAKAAFSHFVGSENMQRCIWDQDGSIVRAYDIKSVPASKKLRL